MSVHKNILVKLWQEDRLAEALRSEIDRGLPGRDQQYRMAPEIRVPLDALNDPRHSAVLILIYPRRDPHLVLMKRTHDGRFHSGQISLPGGRKEPHDPNLQATAIREAREETGAGLDDLDMLGPLTTLHIPVSNFLVHPYIGISRKPLDFRPDPGEVDQLIEFPLYELFDEKVLKRKQEELFGKKIWIPYYAVKGYQVWGATAMVLSEFIELWRRLAAHRAE